MDIARELQQNPDLFFVGEAEDKIVSTCMSGYEGHRNDNVEVFNCRSNIRIIPFLKGAAYEARLAFPVCG